MGTQEEEMSEKTKSIRRWAEIPDPDIKYHTTIVSDGFISNMHTAGRLKNISDEPSKVITVAGNLGPCEICILQPNCSRMCDAKETALIHDMWTRRERT
jgi:hypothetical protein